MNGRWSRRFGCFVGVALLVAACRSGGDAAPGEADQPSGSNDVATSEPVDFEPSDEVPEVDAQPRPMGPLAEVCPTSIVVQTTDPLSVQLGALVALVGDDPTIGDGAVSGPITRVDGTVEDVTLELRAGGPSSGFRNALDLAASDDAITIAHTSVAEMLRRADAFPTVAVAALTDLSCQAVIVDPASFPDAQSVSAVGELGIEVRHFTDAPAFAFMEATGVLTGEQLVDGFGGEPAGFVTGGGSIAQQGDLLLDPAVFETLTQWSRPVVALPLSDAGWADHDDVLAVRSTDIDSLAPCLQRFVPLVQEAIVAYADDPAPANRTLAAARAAVDPLSRITAGLLDAAENSATAVGVVGNGSDATVGDVDVERLDPFLVELAAVLGIDAVPADVLATERFVDPSIGL